MANETKEKFQREATRLGWTVTKWTSNGESDFVIQWATPQEVDEPTAAYSVKVISRETAEKGDETWVPLRDSEGKGSWLYGAAE
ncbi:MAG: hypothetical protein KAJ19_30235, partial [Gammaproteobacteria bacterium]|nr:hypothetical protein [Gammaproteobacteria bacterium]